MARAEGLSFPTVNNTTPPPGTLTCTVALSDVHTGVLEKYWKFMTALTPGKPDKSTMIGLQTADSSNERCILLSTPG